MQHLEEGTIHAWLDGELSAEAAATAEAHARECAQCSALVAEARGLIAASTRILTALDDVPSGVIPHEAAPAVPLRKRHWYDRRDFRAAAAVLLVAGASLVIARSRESGTALKSIAISDRAVTLASPAESAVTTDSAANEAPEEAFSKATGAAGAAHSEDDAARLNARTSPPSLLRGKVSGVETQLEREARARDEMNKAVAQSAPAPMADARESMKATADTATGMRIGALFARSGAVAPSAGRIEGRITEPQGKGLAGANVMVQGTTLSVGTDSAGKFKIDNVPAGEQRLIVRRIGYTPKTIPLSVKDTAVMVNAALAPDVTQLSELVVTGVAKSTVAAGVGAAVVSGPRVIRADSSGGMQNTVYEYSPNVEVTLTEFVANAQNAARRADKVAAPTAMPSAAAPPSAPRQSMNTISWTDRGRSYTLSGPLTVKELEVFKARLMSTRR
jgi:hypothetical protein